MAWSAVPFGSHTRHSTFVRVFAVSVASYGPTVKATRYDDMSGVSRKDVRCRPFASVSVRSIGMFAIAARHVCGAGAAERPPLEVEVELQPVARRAHVLREPEIVHPWPPRGSLLNYAGGAQCRPSSSSPCAI